MSHLDPSITNEIVIPRVESSFFVDRPEARFAIGVLAVGNSVVPGRQQEYDAYFRLRRAVYVEQTGQLSHENVQQDGTDRDEDDARSIAFGIVENYGSGRRLVGTARLIQKNLGTPEGVQPKPLPVEQDWPETFANNPAVPRAAEVSRLISRHEKASMQEFNKRKLYAVLLAYAQANKLGPAYAIVEDWFERDLNRSVPTTRIGVPKYIEHYRDTNLPIEIDMPLLAERIEKTNPGSLSSIQAKIGEVAFYGTFRSVIVVA